MKIAHLIFSEQVAGAERYLLNLLPGLKAEGISCSLICISPAKTKYRFVAFCNELEQNGIQTVLLTAHRFNYLSLAKQINVYLKENDIKYLHAHLFKADILAVMVKKMFNKNIFLLSTKHGYQEKYLTSWPVLKGKIVHDRYHFISKYITRCIDENVAVSAAMSKLYHDLKLTPKTIKYIHHGIDLPDLRGAGDLAKFRLAPAQLVIVGRLEQMKGHRYLLDAMPQIIKQMPQTKLLILGDGTQSDMLKKQAVELGIIENVVFLGFQQSPGSYITASDVMVLPSLFEPFGLVYIEAFALQIPVVAFDVPAGNEIISKNETGFLVPVFDSSALAEKIIFLLKDPLERKRISDNAYAEYKRHYTKARMLKETAAWYGSVIKK